MNVNTGKRGGPTVAVADPGEDEIRSRCAIIRASWGNPQLRRSLNLKPIPDPPEIMDLMSRKRRRRREGGRTAILTEAEVAVIKGMLQRHPPTVKKNLPSAGIQQFLAHWFGVQRVTIAKISAGAIWSHVKATQKHGAG